MVGWHTITSYCANQHVSRPNCTGNRHIAPIGRGGAEVRRFAGEGFTMAMLTKAFTTLTGTLTGRRYTRRTSARREPNAGERGER